MLKILVVDGFRTAKPFPIRLSLNLSTALAGGPCQLTPIGRSRYDRLSLLIRVEDFIIRKPKQLLNDANSIDQ